MKLLFLGDSITDSGHCFDPQNLGEGYVRMIHDKLNELSTICNINNNKNIIMNKGIDGFTIRRVYDMWQTISDKTCWDIVSVLVGINDIGMWMDCRHSDSWLHDAVRNFALVYEDLVTDILDYEIKRIILMEPFLFSWPEKYQLWQPWRKEVSLSIQRIATKYKLDFLPLQISLNDAALKETNSAITTDGIHLTEKGNQILADQWIKKSTIFQ